MPSVDIHLCRLRTKTLFKSQNAKPALEPSEEELSRVLPWLSSKPFLDQVPHPRPISCSTGRKPHSELCVHTTDCLVLMEMPEACTLNLGAYVHCIKP